jgi:hypothetical protein
MNGFICTFFFGKLICRFVKSTAFFGVGMPAYGRITKCQEQTDGNNSGA